MTVKKRRLIFGFFLLMFLLAGTFVVLYSLGWRVNFENFHIQRTGAVAIKTTPRGVSIKLNNKIYSDDSNIIQAETLIPNLLPKNYHLEVTKENYLPYSKNLVIEQAMVSRVLNVFLLPKKITPEKSIALRGNEITDSANGGRNLIIKNTSSGVFYFSETTNASSTLNINSAFSNAKKNSVARKVIFVPFNPEQLVIEDQLGLVLFDIKKSRIETTITATPPLAWAISDSSVYYIRKPAGIKDKLILASYNLIFKSESVLLEMPLDSMFGDKLEKISHEDGQIAILEKSGGLYLFNEATKQIEKIGHSVRSFDFSADGRKIAILDRDGKISILFLKDFDSDIRKKAGEVIRFNIKNKEDLTDIVWYRDSYHLFAKHKNRVDFMEIDDRLPLNIYTFLGHAPSFYYDSNENLFLFATASSEQNTQPSLFRIDFDSF